jgi:hypothetical protein
MNRFQESQGRLDRASRKDSVRKDWIVSTRQVWTTRAGLCWNGSVL